MKLSDLAPKWWSRTDGARVGVSFACPIHAAKGLDEFGSAACLLGRVYIRTEDVDGGAGAGPRWGRVGEDFSAMTLTPSLLCRTVPEKHGENVPEDHSCRLDTCAIVHWHGFVTGGEVSVLPDSVQQ